MFCRECGNESLEKDKFCSACGATTELADLVSNKELRYLEAYFGDKADYYGKQAKKMIHHDSIEFVFTWNWSGFLLNSIHLMYRRSYSFAFLYLFIAGQTGGLLGLGWFICGFANNYLILKKFLNVKIEALNLYPNSESDQLNYLRNKGGVDRFLPLFFLILAAIWVGIFVFLIALFLSDGVFYV